MMWPAEDRPALLATLESFYVETFLPPWPLQSIGKALECPIWSYGPDDLGLEFRDRFHRTTTTSAGTLSPTTTSIVASKGNKARIVYLPNGAKAAVNGWGGV